MSEYQYYQQPQPPVRQEPPKKKNGWKKFLATVLIAAIVGGGAGVFSARYVLNHASVEEGGVQATTVTSKPTNEMTVVDVAHKVMPAVVGVNTFADLNTLYQEQFGGLQLPKAFSMPPRDKNDQYKQISYGSGVIINKDGTIITNYHVIKGGSKVTVTLSDGKQYDAEIKGSDAQADIAVLKIKAPDLPVVEIGDSSKLQVGQTVVAIGNPLGAEFSQTVTDGIISGINRDLRNDAQNFNLIQTNAAINSGNSGGALVDGSGRLIGINTMKISATGVEGLGFAIPINGVMKIVDELIAKGHIDHAYLGFTGYVMNENIAAQIGSKEKSGIIIAQLVKNGPAENAGLQPYDIIIKAEDKKINDFEDIGKLLSKKKPGDKITLTIVRDNQEKEVQVTLGTKPVEAEKPTLQG